MCSKISEEYESSACPPDSGVIRCKPVSPGGTSDPVVYTADIPNTVCEETEGDGDCDAPYYVIINGNTIKRVSEAELQMLEKQCVPRAGAEADIEKLKRSFQNEDANSGLDNSLSEENLLAHISRQVGFQQQLLCSAIDGTLHDSLNEKRLPQYQIEEREDPVGANSLNDHYTILPNLLNQPHIPISWPLGLTPTIATGNIQSTPVNSTAQMPGTILHSQNGTSLVTSTPVTGQRALQSLPMNGQDHCLFTPHPKTGQLLYLAPSDGSSPQLFQQLTPTANTPNTSDFVTPNIREHSKKPAMLKLNSSGEDEDNSHNCSSDSPPTPLDSSSDRDSMQFELSLFNNTGEESREQHNMKERRRRLRIKDACDVMRKLVPGMSDKTDKATVFEFGARYIHFLKGFVGNKHDKDFLIKYSPY
ncbi:uncharacterized protein LOC110466009 isoform X1 [Mizuhopecten yessoensis]|uniref:BHLH domain-containing protein n=1 Tax=Mizuhopecten yessoensis TaxID=6573 RepID=A0A210R1Q8_MIZYE|nr:uncharacterized protein LOC110466009 isoform X1 [Mizuhopecten yessoensis]OWF54968.1 hypothetical protein KP79_PYT17944 [Mizuhopecten yessoensis]